MSVLDAKNVIDWNGRPKRAVKRPPPTYWEEYVETDEWYKKALVEDIPDEEMWAAWHDDELDDDEGEEEEEEQDGEESEDDDYIPMEEEADEASSSEESDDETSEGESGGEGSDGESEGSPVGKERSHSFQLETDTACPRVPSPLVN